MARYPEEKDENGRTLYGGVKDGVLVGGTKVRHSLIWSQERGKFGFSGTFFTLSFCIFTSTQVYLGADFRSLLTGMVSIDARGRVGVQEVKIRQSYNNNLNHSWRMPGIDLLSFFPIS